MPVITVGNKAPAQPRPHRLPTDADNSLHLADVAWTLARIDAYDALEQAETVVKLAERVRNGDRWMAANPEHPKRYEYGSLLYRLWNQQQQEEIIVRVLLRTCWQRCSETYAIILRSGQQDELERRIFGGPVAWDATCPPLTLWRQLLPEIEPPDPNDRGYVLPRGDRTGAALWELDDLREALERRLTR